MIINVIARIVGIILFLLGATGISQNEYILGFAFICIAFYIFFFAD